MALLGQTYYGASDAFAIDPALRELLRSTMDAASIDTEIGLTPPPGVPGGPAPGGIPQQMPNSAAKQDRAAAAMPELKAVNGPPVTPEEIRQRMATPSWGGGTGGPALPPQIAGSPPQRAPGAPTPATNNAAIPNMDRGSSIGAFLAGLGSSDAILPAIGGGIQAVEDRDRANTARNQTLRALINRGLDQDTAMAAIANPEILKAVLPSLFGGTAGGDIEEIYDEETGLPRKVLRTKNGKIIPIGGLKRDPNIAGISKAQAGANLKRVETYKSEADQARSTLSQLEQLKELRKDVNYEGIPFAEPVAQFLGWSGLGETFGAENAAGAGASLASNAATLQLGFTSLTKGAISDREMALFGTATPGIKMGDAAAANVMAGMEAGAQRVLERSKFYEKWFAGNNGSLEGAQEAWDAYVAANPIIEKTPTGIAVNKKNISNWQDYVSTNSTPSAAAQRGPAETAVTRTPSAATPSTAPSARPMPNGSIAQSPHDTGEAVPGMQQLKDGTWVMPDPSSPTGFKKWVP